MTMIRTLPSDSKEQLSEHFNASEFRCKCGKAHDFKVSEELVEKLEALRSALGCSRINITSGFRCVAHDKHVGGSGSGQHTLGKAADICCYDANGAPISSKTVCCKAQDIGFSGIANITAQYIYTHVDVRSGRWYGDEVHGNSYCIPSRDFYEYYGIMKGDAAMYKGIDVSSHQGKIDWSKVKASGVQFAILRAGYGKISTQKDSCFESNYAGAKAAGIPVGAYWYSYAKTPEDARLEADLFLETLKGKKLEYPVFMDVEEQTQFALGKSKVSEIIETFLMRVEKAGYWVGLYMSASPLKQYVADAIKQRYAIWVANYGVSKPSYNGSYGIWQYSASGKVDGITGDVDLDNGYVDYPEKIKEKGLNGFGGVPPENDTKPEEMYIEVAANGKRFAGTLKEIR